MKHVNSIFLAALLCVGLGVSACGKEESAVESTTESVKDALDVREHEKIKDAAEDMKSAMDNVGEAAKEKAEDVKEAVEK